MNNKKYYLGLDLGISSVGWAVMSEENGKYNIDDFGVRLFECSENAQDGKTNAEKRREFRGSRRLIRRRRQRITDLKSFLATNNIITPQEINEFYQTHKVTNNIKYDETKYFNPYVIRVKGLTTKLTPAELAVALINIAKHRGYNDKFSFGENSKETKLTSSMDEAQKLVTKYSTIAQAIINDEKFILKENNNTIGRIHNKIKINKQTINIPDDKKAKPEVSNYHYLFDRESYKQELEQILTTQTQFYPQLLTTKADHKQIDILINDIILRQRDFETGPGPKDEKKYTKWEATMQPHRLFKTFLKTEGYCTFYRQSKEPRGYRCALTFELFQFVSAISTFTVKSLTKEETQNLAEIVFKKIQNHEILDKTKMKKIIIEDLKKDATLFTNNQAWNNKEMKFNFGYLKLLKKLIPSHFKDIEVNNLSNHIFNQLGKILHENITPARRKNALNEFFIKHKIVLTEKQVEEFLNLPAGLTSTANTSFKYMEEAIKAFSKGISLGNFQAEFTKNNQAEMFDFGMSKQLFAPVKDEDMSKNAVVFRAVNQARKIIKALHQKYFTPQYQSFFEVINVEVARELAKSFKERNKIKYNNNDNYEKRIKIEEELKVNNITPNKSNIDKYILWKQQDKKCIYCQDHHEIKIEQFNTRALEIDHIIPQSVIADDSLHNKVLVCAKANQLKGKQTPLEWLKNNPEHKKSFIIFCKIISKNLSDKKMEYLETTTIDEETLNDFASRNLNDTRYITRYITNWLMREFKNWEKNTGEAVKTNVQSINGSVTSRFRRMWLKPSPWGLNEKVRDITPFHHAVDAIILTQFTSISYVAFASDIASITNLRRMKYKRIISEEEYKQNCEEILAKWSINKLHIPDAVTRLKQLINSEKHEFKIMSPLIKDLKKVVETRIPVVLKTVKEIKKFTLKNKENKESGVPDQDVKREIDVPKYVTVLNQEEYYQKLKDLNFTGDIHYPFISYKVDYKLSGAVTSSQMPVNTRYEWKNHKESGTKIKFKRSLKENGKLKNSYIEGKDNTFWEVDKYYGIVIKFDENKKIKPEWIRRINAKKDYLTDIRKNQIVLVPRNIVEYYDKQENKKIIKLFHGKTSKSVYSNLLGTTNIQNLEKSKATFGKQNYYDSISNWEKDFKILKPNILGKIVPD